MSHDELKKAGLKVTLPRLRILEILEKADSHHLSAETIYKLTLEQGEDIGLATVYRVLTQFEESGLVVRHNFEGGTAIFELNRGIHHHLVCVECGQVEEFSDDILERRQVEIAKKANYTVVKRSLNIYGVCANCRKRT